MRTPLVAVAALSALATGSVRGADTPLRVNPVPYFVTLEPMEMPIMSPSQIEGRMQVSLVLEAKDAESAHMLDADMPRLRALSLANAIEYGRLHVSGFRAVDVAALNASVGGALKSRYAGINRVLVVKVAAMPAV
ncbi:MAG TPA: hypothetical protein VF503_04205 [Sphingobium sp.]|uniref:hypothetical protein n=1 Tax=Sphingobium sp. TaxID=1912891 RepID=UPI002ED19B86